MTKGMTYDQLFPGRFLKAGEFDGRDVTLAIKDVYVDQIEGEDGVEKPQPVVSFEATKRELALNKTNAQCMVAMWGDNTADWVNKRITLTPERDPSGLSASGLCIRVKGSPELEKPVKLKIKLTRRAPVERTLVSTDKVSATEDPGALFDGDEEETS